MGRPILGTAAIALLLVACGNGHETGNAVPGQEVTTSTDSSDRNSPVPTDTEAPGEMWTGSVAEVEKALTSKWSDPDLGSFADVRCFWPPQPRAGDLVPCFADVPIASETFGFDLLLEANGAWTEQEATAQSQGPDPGGEFDPGRYDSQPDYDYG